MKRLTLVLELVFLARTSFWQETKIINNKRLLSSVFPYIFSTLIVLIGCLLFKNQFNYYGGRLRFLFNISLKDAVYLLVLFIVLTGPVYENLGYLRTNTDKTLKVFFNVSYFEQYWVNVLKNLIIMAPLFPFLVTFKVYIFFIIAIVDIFVSIYISHMILLMTSFWDSLFKTFTDDNYQKRHDIFPVIIKRIPVGMFIKPFSGFGFTLLVVFGVKYFTTSFLIFDTYEASFFSGIALAAMSFTVPFVGYYFLATFIEYDYFYTVSKSIKAKELYWFVILNFTVIIPTTISINVLLFTRTSVNALLYFNIGWFVYIIEMCFMQFYKGKVVQSKLFDQFDLIKRYKIPWIDIWPLILNNGILALILFLIRFVFSNSVSPVISIVLYLIFNIVAVIQYRRILYGSYT